MANSLISAQFTQVNIQNDHQKPYILYDADTQDSLFASSTTQDIFLIEDNMNEKRTLFILIEQRYFHYIVLHQEEINLVILDGNSISFKEDELNTEIFETIEKGRKISLYDHLKQKEKNRFFYAYYIKKPSLYLTLEKVYFDLESLAHSRDSILAMFEILDKDLKQFSLWEKCYDLLYPSASTPTFNVIEKQINDCINNTIDSTEIVLNYETGDFVLTDEYKLSINKIFFGIKQAKIRSITVIGYTDDVGEENDNYLLAKKRARLVVDYLNQINYPSEMVVNGEKALNNSDNIETQRKNNRIVKIKIVFDTQLQVGETLVLENVLFKESSDEFLPQSFPALRELLSLMTINEDFHIDLQGHICCSQTKSDNGLSQRRAKKVYDYLVINGIDKERMTYQGFGGLKPLYENIGDYRNKRVEIKRTK